MLVWQKAGKFLLKLNVPYVSQGTLQVLITDPSSRKCARFEFSEDDVIVNGDAAEGRKVSQNLNEKWEVTLGSCG